MRQEAEGVCMETLPGRAGGTKAFVLWAADAMGRHSASHLCAPRPTITANRYGKCLSPGL